MHRMERRLIHSIEVAKGPSFFRDSFVYSPDTKRWKYSHLKTRGKKDLFNYVIQGEGRGVTFIVKLKPVEPLYMNFYLVYPEIRFYLNLHLWTIPKCEPTVSRYVGFDIKRNSAFFIFTHRRLITHPKKKTDNDGARTQRTPTVILRNRFITVYHPFMKT